MPKRPKPRPRPKPYVAILLALAFPACGILENVTPKDVARYTNDAAKALCEAFYAENPRDGISPEELCRKREMLDPFIREVVASKQSLKASLSGSAE